MNLFDLFNGKNEPIEENLRKWFKEKWVRFGPDGKIRGDCARGDSSEGKPKCLPQSKAHALGKKGRASAAARKRRQDPDANRSGAAKNVATKKESINQSVTDGQLNELDIFAPVTTYVRLANGEYVAANWRRNQDLSSGGDSASFIDVKPLDAMASKRLGLDNILKDPRRQNDPSNANKLQGNTTIAQGGPIQGTGPLGDRTVKVVDISNPDTIKNAGVPDSVIAKVAQWAEKTTPGMAEGKKRRKRNKNFGGYWYPGYGYYGSNSHSGESGDSGGGGGESRRYDSIKQAQAAAKKHAETHFKPGVAEGSDILKVGTAVRVPHKGKMMPGKVVRYDKGDKHGSPFYVVDVGEYESPKVPAHYVKQGVAEGLGQKMSVKDTLAYLKKVMGTESHEDWRNHIVNTNEYFVLKDLPVSSLKSDLSGLDKANVEKYKQMDFSKAPPIVVGSDGNILDGYHRVNVAKALAVPALKAWVGVKKQGVAEGLDNVPPTLYHATYRPLLKSIEQHGLGGDKAQSKWEDSKPGVVYLALDKNVAESYAETSDVVPDDWIDKIIILEISTAGLDPNKFNIDNNVQDNEGDTLEYHGIIPVSNIKIVKQGVAEDVPQPGKLVTDAILKVMPIAQEIWFHGSRATGKQRRNSDTDILVVIPDDIVGSQYLAVVTTLQKLSSLFDNYDIQPTKSGRNIHRIAQEEGKLLWSNKQDMAEGKRIARKPGQPANSKKHSDLYTDENPKGTITGLKFATVDDARASVTKIRNSGRSHAHKIQAAVAMEQRAKAAGKSSEAGVYRKFIDSMKKKTNESLDNLEPFDRGVVNYMQDNTWLSAERAYFRMIGLQKKRDTRPSDYERIIQRYIDLYDQYKGQSGVAEEWSKKYKSSINCSNPKGFSQRAHCDGRKKNESEIDTVEEDTDIPFDTCPSCGGSIVHESQLNEKQDACYHKVKRRYKVWPSAYASGALVQCRKKGAANWGNKSESVNESESDSGKPRIRRYTVLRPDGSKSVRYEVLNYKGVLVQGGFDDIQYAREYALRNYERISAPYSSMEEATNPTDTVKMDVPLLLRVMEYSKEDAKTDIDLHDVVTKLVDMSRTGETLTMKNYNDAVEDAQEPAPNLGEPSIAEQSGRYWCKTDRRWKDR